MANPEEAKVVVDLENALTVFDCVGACKFMGLLLYAQDNVDLIAKATSSDFTVQDFRKSGERVYNLVRFSDHHPPRVVATAPRAITQDNKNRLLLGFGCNAH